MPFLAFYYGQTIQSHLLRFWYVLIVNILWLIKQIFSILNAWFYDQNIWLKCKVFLETSQLSLCVISSWLWYLGFSFSPSKSINKISKTGDFRIKDSKAVKSNQAPIKEIKAINFQFAFTTHDSVATECAIQRDLKINQD